MKRMPRPPARYSRDLRRALNKHEARRYATSIEAACEQARVYSRVAPDLHHLRSRVRRGGVRDFFVRLYDRDRKAVERIKENLRHYVLSDEVVKAACQYCGLSEPCTLDHFLEKTRFPELSLYTRNLIPCCWECNHGRKAAFSSNGERQLLHFYEDDVDSMPDVLTASVAMSAAKGLPVVTYSVAQSAHPLRDLYERHFDALGLKERYRIQAAAELKRIKQRARSVPRTRLATELQSYAAARARLHGPNDHLAALWRAVAANSTALSWLVR